MRKLLFPLLLLSQISLAAEEKIECVGLEAHNAKAFYVFLHGAGTDNVHKRNVAALKQIGESKSVRFAIPIAKSVCTDEEFKGRPCFFNYQGETYDQGLAEIKAAAEHCFSGKEHGLIGFSNGALFVNNLVRRCVENEFTRLIAVGAGIPPQGPDAKDLSSCKPPLLLLAGKSDKYLPNVKRAFEYYKKKKKTDATFDEYDGDHELKAQPLDKFF